MSAYDALKAQQERLLFERERIERECDECLARADELHRLREELTGQIADLISARGALIAAQRRRESAS